MPAHEMHILLAVFQPPERRYLGKAPMSVQEALGNRHLVLRKTLGLVLRTFAFQAHCFYLNRVFTVVAGDAMRIMEVKRE